MNGVPVFIFNNKWTLTGAQAPKIIGTTIDIASKD
jgi:predicted DsbA family dithiol-disulfide isomerase